MTCYRDYSKKGVVEELSIMSESVECCDGCGDGCDCNDCFDGCCDNCCDDCCGDCRTSCTLIEFNCLGCAGCFDSFDGCCDGNNTRQQRQEQEERERQYMQDQSASYSEINQPSLSPIQSQPQNTEFVPPVSTQPPPSDQPPPYPGTQI